MNCPNCGAPVEEGGKFCTSCGSPIAAPAAAPQQPQYTAPQPQYQQPQYAPPQYQYGAPQYQQPYTAVPVRANVNANPVLTWGILGLAFACTFFVSFLGIIFSAVGRGKAKAYAAQAGQLSGKARVGSILSLVGLILGIVMTVFFIIWLIAICAIACS